METIEYETVWNGVNDGRDGDLLRQEIAQPDKVQLPPRPVLSNRRVIWAALPTTQDDAVDFAALVARTGLSKQMINSALYTLRREGLLSSAVIDVRYFGRRRAPKRYWRNHKA